MRIGGFDTSDRVLVMAELGNNHEGQPEVARELVERAAEAGADAVKLQTYEPERFVRPRDADRLAQLKRFQLGSDTVAEIAALVRERGMLFVSTPFDLPSVELLEPLVDGYKIASGDNDVYGLIARVAETGQPLIVSSGLADLDTMRRAKECAENVWRERSLSPGFVVLHCVSAYPVSAEQASLGAIPALAEALDCTIGYSDHTLGVEACVAAVALGARILEKHLTLRHDFSDYRDHQLSAEPDELAELVRAVRATEALGEDERARVVARAGALVGERAKAVQPEEKANEQAVRRSIVAAGDLAAGHVIELGDLTWMRPRDGLAPGQEDELVGRSLRRAVAHGESILVEDLG